MAIRSEQVLFLINNKFQDQRKILLRVFSVQQIVIYMHNFLFKSYKSQYVHVNEGCSGLETERVWLRLINPDKAFVIL